MMVIKLYEVVSEDRGGRGGDVSNLTSGCEGDELATPVFRSSYVRVGRQTGLST
jgi:hypothetical protein